MGNITATQVKDLRERTGVGMMDSKRTLERFGGDVEYAEAYLGAASCALLVLGDRDKWNLQRATKMLGREPIVDFGGELL